jgi:uncharacterized protein
MLKRIFTVLTLVLIFGFIVIWLAGSYLAQSYRIEVENTSMPLSYQAININASRKKLFMYQRKHPNARANVLLLHGIRAHHQSQLSKANRLFEQGFNVYLLDFQAHGFSDGDLVTFGHLEGENVDLALTYIESISDLPNVSIGMSMGGAASIFADKKADIMIIEAVYADIQLAIFNRIESRIGTIWAEMLTPILSYQLQWRTGQNLEDFKPSESIKSISQPILVIGGSIDDRTPIRETQRLYNNAASVQKELWIVEGASHENFYEFDRVGYQKSVIGFIEDNI